MEEPENLMKKYFTVAVLSMSLLGMSLPNTAFAQAKKLAQGARHTVQQTQQQIMSPLSGVAFSTKKQIQGVSQRTASSAQTTKILSKKLGEHALKNLERTLRQKGLSGQAEVVSALQKKRSNKNYYSRKMYEEFVLNYYQQNFGRPTHKIISLIHNVGRLRSVQAEEALLSRLIFLNTFSNTYLENAKAQFPISRMRLFYKGSANAHTFNPELLTYEFEIQTQPGELVPTGPAQLERFLSIEGKITHIAGFNQDLKYLPSLYSLLLNSNTDTKPTVWIDAKGPLFILSNPEQTRWIRVAKHEISSIVEPHIHLYWKTILQSAELPQTENVVINVSIPLQTPGTLPLAERQHSMLANPAGYFLKKSGNPALPAEDF